MKMDWGNLALINLYQCNENKIKDKKQIKKFIGQLCRIIEMKRFGKSIIKRFGKGKLRGYSVIQLIETSSITIHFDEIENRAFIDIFSCKKFDEKKAEEFSREFFKAEKSKIKTLFRN